MQRAAYQISKECACSSMGREHMWGGTGLANESLLRAIVSHLHPAHRSTAGKAGPLFSSPVLLTVQGLTSTPSQIRKLRSMEVGL